MNSSSAIPGIDAILDPGVGVRRAKHVSVSHSRKHDVVHILAATAKKPRVLEPGDRLADCKLTHSNLADRDESPRPFKKAQDGNL